MAAEAFLGRWRLTKRITDAHGPDAWFEGTAEIAPDGPVWRYVEAGVLRLDDAAPMAAERCYLWRPAETRIGVAFADGRPFHDLPLAGGAVRHDCPPDTYDGWYDFADWPVWRLTWHVAGPRKALIIAATYAPALAEPRAGGLAPEPDT